MQLRPTRSVGDGCQRRSKYSRAADNIQDHDLRLEYQAQDEDLASFHHDSWRDSCAPDQSVNGFSM
jgi:hypothetical protein